MQHQEPVHVFERLVGTMKVGELAERAGVSVSDLIDRVSSSSDVDFANSSQEEEIAAGCSLEELEAEVEAEGFSGATKTVKRTRTARDTAKKSSPKRVRSVSADSILSALPQNGSWVSLRDLRRRFRIAVDVLDGTLKNMLSSRSILADKDEAGEVVYKRSGR